MIRGQQDRKQSSAGSPDEAVTCFVHIPKTAGSTVAEILRVVHGAASVLELPPQSMSNVEAAIRSMSPQVKAVCGHVRYGLHVFTPRPVRYCTFLRDPVDVVLSLFHYIPRQPEHPLHERARAGQLTIEDCAEIARDRQVHFVAGIPPGVNRPLDEALALAKANLEHRFVVFGLVERFDESIILFKRALGWNIQSYRAMNVTGRRPGREALRPDQIASLEPYCAGDAELYRFAAELFERRLAELSGDFAGEVSCLQRNTRIRAKIQSAFSWLKPARKTKR